MPLQGIFVDKRESPVYTNCMIRSNLRQIKLNREDESGHKITYEMINEATGISANAIARLVKPGATVERIDGSTLSGLCRYFGCGVGDILEYVSDHGKKATV